MRKVIIILLLSQTLSAQVIQRFDAIVVPNTNAAGTVGTLSSGAFVIYQNFQPATFADGLLPAGASSNLFFGPNSGNLTLSNQIGSLFFGGNNIGIGVSSLQGLTQGYSNIGIGSRALVSTTTGNSNVGVGY